MTKYIDAEKLKAQIQSLIDSGYDSLQGNLHHVLSIIDSLQQEQPEVDLEEEIKKCLKHGKIVETKYRDYDDIDIKDTARHFYELGLKAGKEE